MNIVQYLYSKQIFSKEQFLLREQTTLRISVIFGIKEISKKHEVRSHFALTDSRNNTFLSNRFNNTVDSRRSESMLYLISHGRIIAARYTRTITVAGYTNE